MLKLFSYFPFVLFLIIIPYGLLCQPIVEPINEKLLEHLVKEKIDSVRKSHGLFGLANDSILYVASKHHASYLKSKNRLSHFEKEKKYKTPQDRAIAYGVGKDYLVGENIALGFYLKSVKEKRGTTVYSDYSKLAEAIVKQWVNSPGHYKNIITPEYDVTGVAIDVNRVDRSVFFVQKFADVLYQYQFTENKEFFNYSTYDPPLPVNSFDSVKRIMHEEKHVWGIKSPEIDDKYIKNNQIIEMDPRILKIQPDRNRIKVSTHGVDHLYQFIEKRKDGLAIEVISYDEYACGNPLYYTAQSRRNNQCEFSGQVLKPKYRKSLKNKIEYSYTNKYRGLSSNQFFVKAAINAFKPKKKKHFKTTLGIIPKDKSGLLEFNLVYLKNKEVVRVRHLTDVCGDSIGNYNMPNYIHELNQDTLQYTVPKLDSTFYFYFSKGKSEYKMEDLQPVLFADFNKYLINKVNIKAFSSIEGQKNINDRLQQERALSIVNALQAKQDLIIEPTLSTEANWNLFQQQLVKSNSFGFLKKASRAEQKLFVDSAIKSNVVPQELSDMLDSQRVAQIRVRGKYNLNKYRLDLYLKYYDTLMFRYTNSESKLFSRKLDNEFKHLLNLIYNYINKGVFDKHNLNLFKPPWHKDFPESLFHYYVISKQLDIEGSELMMWVDLYNLVYDDKRQTTPKITNNMLREQLELLDTTPRLLAERSENLEKIIKRLGSITNYEEVGDSFAVKLYINILNQVKTQGNTDIFSRANEFIYKHFKSKRFNPDEIYKIASLFTFIENLNYAYLISEPYISIKNPHLELITLYTKLIYQNKDEYPETLYGEWLRSIFSLFPKQQWCDLFVGPCNISFQVFDDESLRDFYCKKCSEFGNYATDFMNEKTDGPPVKFK